MKNTLFKIAYKKFQALTMDYKENKLIPKEYEQSSLLTVQLIYK